MRVNLINENFENNYFSNLLKARGVTDIDGYVNPTEQYLQSPLDLKNIRTAAALYMRVVLNDKPPYSKVLIVVDSDNDGYTSAAIMYQYTKRLNCHCRVDYWLHEGKQHGLQDHIDRLMDNDESYDLIILPDSSSNDFEQHETMRARGVDVLVIDHHEADRVSEYACIINNQLCDYPTKSLSGVGMVYKFCSYMDELLNVDYADDYLDLVALGMVADMMDLRDFETRHLITRGLENIRNPYFKGMVDKQAYSLKDGISPIGVAFYIAPYVNATIRMGTQEEKLMLFESMLDLSLIHI